MKNPTRDVSRDPCPGKRHFESTICRATLSKHRVKVWLVLPSPLPKPGTWVAAWVGSVTISFPTMRGNRPPAHQAVQQLHRCSPGTAPKRHGRMGPTGTGWSGRPTFHRRGKLLRSRKGVNKIAMYPAYSNSSHKSWAFPRRSMPVEPEPAGASTTAIMRCGRG